MESYLIRCHDPTFDKTKHCAILKITYKNHGDVRRKKNTIFVASCFSLPHREGDLDTTGCKAQSQLLCRSGFA